MASPTQPSGDISHNPTNTVCLRDPILQRLKRATQIRHAVLESRSILLDPDLSRSRYVECLCRFFGYYAPLEIRMQASPGWQGAGFAYEERYKTAHLRQDLLALGVLPEDVPALEQSCELPDLTTSAALFGCLYVLEGATLGGQIISRHLHASLGLTPTTGGAFFGGYGELSGSRWKIFGAHLTAYAEKSNSDDAIVASANRTFETLDHWLYPVPIPETLYAQSANRC